MSGALFEARMCVRVSHDLASLVPWQAQYFRDMGWKNRKTHWHEAVSLSLSFPFLKEVSPNYFVFDVVCQLRKLRKYRRFALFLTLSSSKIEEVSQTCFVFDVVDFESLAE